MRPCREHRRAVCAFSARPLHHEPAPGPACRDARQRQRNLSTAASKLTGKKPQSLTFVLRGTLRADKSGYDGAAMTVQAANNGMLNIARLASDYITAARTMRAA